MAERDPAIAEAEARAVRTYGLFIGGEWVEATTGRTFESRNPADRDEVARAEGLCQRLVERALAMEGTCTGEHGVGQGKMKYLAPEHGEPALAAMRALKRALDPQGIMNPGKIVALG